MRQDAGFGFQLRRPTPVVGATLVVLLVVFVVTALAARVEGGQRIIDALVLVPSLTLHGERLWTLLTAALLHSLDDPMHILFNGLVLYFFGPDLEELYGRGRFVGFMVLCALVGNMVAVGAVALGISHAAAVIGFSGVTMGITAAWGLTFPDREMLFFFFPMRGLTLVYVTLAFEILEGLSFSNTSAAAHFGGMAAGAAFTLTQGGPVRRWWLQRKLRRLQATREGLRGARRASGPDLRVIRGGGEAPKDKRSLN